MVRIFIFFTLSLVLLNFFFYPLQFSIQSPRLGQPIIAQSAQNFDIELNMSLPLVQPNWTVYLSQAESKIALEVVSQSGWLKQRVISVKLPEGIQLNELPYDLAVEWVDVKQVRKSAFFLRDNLSDSFNLVHLADPVIFGTKGDQEIMQSLVDEVNLLSPDLIIFSGDLAKGGRWEQYRQFMSWMEKIDVPIILGPGNHAYDGWGGYLTIIGNPKHKDMFGDWCVITMNSGHGRDQWTVSQFDWFKQQIDTCDNGKIIIHSHHPLFYKRNVKARVDAFINELKLKSVPLMLHGHWHLDGVFNEQGVRQKETPVFSGIKFISTTAAGDKLRNYFDREKDKIYHGYRLIKFDDGEVTSYTFDLDKDGVDDAELSAPYGTVSSDYHQGVLTVVNHHNVELMLKPKLNFKDEHVCLEDGTKPYLSVKNKERWEHRFKLKLAKQSGKQIRVLPGAYCQ